MHPSEPNGATRSFELAERSLASKGDCVRVQIERTRTAWSIVACGACVLALAAWSAWPSQRAELPRPATLPSSGVADRTARDTQPLDQAAFDTAIWVPLPPPPEVATPPAPSPPLKVTLLGIERSSDGELRAVIYDQQADSVMILRSGDSIRGRRVRTVGIDGVELSTENGASQRLAMENSPNGPAPLPAARRRGAQ